MYEDFFGLKSSPFQLSPDPSFIVPSEKSQEALASISDAIRLRKGFVVMTGEVGTGKTLVLRCLIEFLEREEISFAYFIGPRLSTTDFLSYIAFELGLTVAEPTKGNLLRALYVFLLAEFEKGLTTVLIIDEAHQMPRSVLEEIRLLTNFETAQQKLVQIVLVGQPELDKKLDSVELRSLKQRIAVRCQLEPLGGEAIRHYIERRLELAGAGSEAAVIFPAETIKAIHRYSQGIPRLVNSICDQALTAAHARQMRVVPVEVIKTVASQFRLEPGGNLKQTEKPISLASQAESSAPESPWQTPSLSDEPAPVMKGREPDATAAPPREVSIMPVPAALSILPEPLPNGSLRDVVAPPTRQLEVKSVVAKERPFAGATQEPAVAAESSFRSGRAAQLTSFQQQGGGPAFGRRAIIPPDPDLPDTWSAHIRRWLKPGLRLSLIMGAAALVPVALATGIYMARHQKTAQIAPAPMPVSLREPLQVVSPERILPVMQAAATVPPVGSSPALGIAVDSPGEIVHTADNGPSKPAGTLKRLAPRLKAPIGEPVRPVSRSHAQAPAAEAPPIAGTQTRDPDIERVLLGNSVPSFQPPMAMQTKEAGLGKGLLETSVAGPAPVGANAGRHLEPPKLLSSPPPIYPSMARTTNVEGPVLIDAIVDEAGRVTDMKVISGNPVLRKAAMESLRMWKYQPARLDDQPAVAHIQVRINFSLH